MPNQTTGGDHAFTGQEVRFDINFITASNPLDLPSGHYFFVPQVELTGTDGTFLWLSATRPLAPPSTVFAPDLQSWTRDGSIDAAFSLSGTLPDTGSTALLLGGALLLIVWLKRRVLIN